MRAWTLAGLALPLMVLGCDLTYSVTTTVVTDEHAVFDGGAWQPRAAIPEPGFGAVVVTLSDRVHWIGGVAWEHQVYDPVTDTWIAAAPAPFPNSAFQPWGVAAAGSIFAHIDDTQPVQAFDPASGTWRPTTLRSPQFWVAVGVLADRIYIVDGLGWVVAYDAVSNVVSSGSASPLSGGRVVGAGVAAGRVFVVEEDASGTELRFHALDAASGLWSTEGPVPSTGDPTGTVREAAGFAVFYGRTFGASLVARRDPAGGVWSLGAAPAEPLRHLGGTSGYVLELGGTLVGVDMSDAPATYDPVADRWTTGPVAPFTPVYPAVAAGRLHLLGGLEYGRETRRRQLY